MKHPLLLPVAVLALATACSDVPNSPVSPDRASLAALPPPPVLRGGVSGSFTVSSSTEFSGSYTSSSVVVPPGPPFTHVFTILFVEFNANQTQTFYVMNYPRQTLPPAASSLKVSKGRIEWNGSISLARGRIFSFDPVNNGYWLINLNQYSGQTTNPFQPCAAATTLCTQLVPPVIAQFFQIVGVREDGTFQFREYNSAPGSLSFVGAPVGPPIEEPIG